MKNRYKESDFNLDDIKILDEDLYVHKRFKDIEFNDDLIGISFDDCEFINCTFKGKVKNCSFFNVKFYKCEISNIMFINNGIHYTLFDTCHLVGINFIDSKIKNSEFVNSHMRFGSLSTTELKEVDFKECNMMEFRFFDISFEKNILFDNCNLEDLEVSGTSLKDVDVRSSNIDGIRVSVNDVKGLIVTEVQAISLIYLLGIVIK